MEDLDPPREQEGAAQSLLHSLQAHGLEWDGPVLWQGERSAAYEKVLRELLADKQAFRCGCSRAQLRAQGGVYRGHCRNRHIPDDQACALRVKVDGDSNITVADQLQQAFRQDVSTEVGDFIIKRRDDLYAYQLAVVIDYHFQGITQVLRGSDLYDSTPRQVYLQRLLGLDTPIYTHIPVITNSDGQKLSKQTHAPALRDEDAEANMRLSLRFLGQAAPPRDCHRLETLLQFAVDNWQLDLIPDRDDIPEATLY